MIKLLKIIICLFLISYSISFYIFFLNELYIDGFLRYLITIVTHFETLMLIPSILILMYSLHPKI